MPRDRDALITGIGLVSCLGEGLAAHRAALSTSTPSGFTPVVDETSFAPFSVHPIVPLEFDRQIPKRGDQRQMEPWQRIGTYAAGLALQEAGIKGDPALLARTHMIVAAGGGERDPAVDEAILSALPAAPDPAALLNERLMTDLRPTLFLAQLSNLLAGNISIVHGVVGSSRTFMGEEPAGADAVRIACARIAAGQGDLFLVGASCNAQRPELLLHYAMGRTLWAQPFQPVWARQAEGGGIALGSLGCFLVIESRAHAEARGASAFAAIAAIGTDRSRRQPGAATANAARQLEAMGDLLDPTRAAVLSAASGAGSATAEERGLPRPHRPAGPGRRHGPRPLAGTGLPGGNRPRCPGGLGGTVVSTAGTGRNPHARQAASGPGHRLGPLARRGARARHRGMTEAAMHARLDHAQLDHAGRPIVVITGLGILSSLGQGVSDNWRRLTAGELGLHRISRFSVAGLRTTVAGTVDFVPLPQPSSAALAEAMAGLVIEEAVAAAGIGSPGAFPGPLFLALAPVEMEWPQRQAVAAASGAAPATLRRPAARRRGRRLRSQLSAFPVRLGRRGACRALRHHRFADCHLHGLRLGRDRDPARAGSDPAWRDRRGALRRHRRLGEPGIADPLLSVVGSVHPQRPARIRRPGRSARIATAL